MFLLLLIAVLVGCQQFSGHCPIDNTVLCPLWRMGNRNKEAGGAPTQSLFGSEEGQPPLNLNVAVVFLWCDKSFWDFSGWSPWKEGGGYEMSWGKWLIIMWIYSFIFGHKCLCSGKTIRRRDIENAKLLPTGYLSSPHW